MSSAVLRCCTFIYPQQLDRHAVRRLPFMNWQWISFSSLKWACRAGQNEFSLHVRLTGPWQSPITAASSSHNLWPPCLPLHPHPISLGWDGGQKKQAGGFASVRESACRWSYDACRPFVQQAVRPPPGSNCQVRDQTSVEAIFTFISHPHCTIGRFPLQLWASVQITVTV